MSDSMTVKGVSGFTSAPPAPPTPAPVVLFRSILTPVEVWNKLCEVGTLKAKFSLPKKLLLSFLAGCYLSFGFALAFSVGGMLTTGVSNSSARANNPGLFNVVFGFFGLPFGLSMVILMGSELFTSDVPIMMIAWLEGKVTVSTVVWNWVWCWLGNLCGSLWLAQCCIWAQTFASPASVTFISGVAMRKVTFGWGVMFVRGMLCNWLVNIAVWQATAANDTIGKVAGVFIPITIFVACGFEHCVANMFALAMGLRLGNGAGAREAFVHNLVPVTLGNAASAAIFIAGFYALTVGKAHDKLVDGWNGMVAGTLGSQPWLARLIMTGDEATMARAMEAVSNRKFEDSAKYSPNHSSSATMSAA